MKKRQRKKNRRKRYAGLHNARRTPWRKRSIRILRAYQEGCAEYERALSKGTIGYHYGYRFVEEDGGFT